MGYKLRAQGTLSLASKSVSSTEETQTFWEATAAAVIGPFAVVGLGVGFKAVP